MSQSEYETLDTGTVTFSSDSKLLSEIGERLIATPDIALSELIKNAYDADATKCNIWLEQDELIVKDDGHGMTETEFREYWMTIATTSRLDQETSRRYNRELTGAKGIGRFAVRNLGLELTINTVAWYEEHEEYRRLVAELEWGDFQSGAPIQDEKVDYRIEAASEENEGTTLQISQLQDDWTQEELEEVSGEVLDIISAPYETNRSELQKRGGDNESDPGFTVYFAPPGKGEPEKSAAQEIYERYVMKVEIFVDEDTLRYDCEYSYGYDDEAETREYEFEIGENLIGDVSGEIRYFNASYQGVFKGIDTIDGRSAPKWLRENSGVRILDKGFRVPPYGDDLNDWLNISESQARRERKWRSPFTSNISFDENEMLADTFEHQLNLPSKNQLLGSVHVSSYRPGEGGNIDSNMNRLVPAMDRQGFVENEAMEQLRDITRGAIEAIAILDKEEEVRRLEKEAEKSESELKEEIDNQREQIEEGLDSVVEELEEGSINTTDLDSDVGSESDGQLSIEDSLFNEGSKNESDTPPPTTETTISPGIDGERVRQKVENEIKPQIQESYTELKNKVEDTEEARAEHQSSVESMYLMSAVAAFMTHETSELLRCADEMIEVWEKVPENERSEELEQRLEVTREAKNKFDKQLGYSKRFMQGLEQDTESKMFVSGKVDEVVDQFNHYTDRKGIKIERDFSRRLETPPLNPSVYTGVLMNLFTNAIKAVLDVAPKNSGRIIRFEAENTDEWHKIRVADTGSGIPDGLRDRIFDPLFSTTESRDDDPLGAGIGLGLYVVKRVVENSDGEISIIDPPEGFETCFEVKFQR
jgi:signal transduction histidine kinase